MSFLTSTKRVRSFMVSPPCTTFSIMRRPALRSKTIPHGFDPACPLTRNGNLLAHRGFQLMRVGWVNGVPGIFETPFTALLKHLPGYRSFLGKPSVEMCRTDSCMFGSIHQKSFRLLGVHVSLKKVAVSCDRSHEHVVIQGAWTKASATYVPRLAESLAEILAEAVQAMKEKVSDLHKVAVRGHESQLVNSIALSSNWKAVESWTFGRLSHINILEMTVLAKLANHLAARAMPLRVSALVDSFVCSAAASKGRSSSVGLSRPLRRFCATCVAAFLFFAVPFVPTRLNPADDPTRDAPVRSSSGSFDLVDWTLEDVQALCCLPRLRRWASNWVRLTLSLRGPSLLFLGDRSLFRQCVHGPPIGSQAFDFPCIDFPSAPDPDVRLDFDTTLGFPGEGPVPLNSWFGPPSWGRAGCLSWLFCLWLLPLFLSFGFLNCCRSKFHLAPVAMAFCGTKVHAVLVQSG